MFTTFYKLNEGGCKEEELREGTNPKVPEREPQLRGWASGKNRACKNARWEQLR